LQSFLHKKSNDPLLGRSLACFIRKTSKRNKISTFKHNNPNRQIPIISGSSIAKHYQFTILYPYNDILEREILIEHGYLKSLLHYLSNVYDLGEKIKKLKDNRSNLKITTSAIALQLSIKQFSSTICYPLPPSPHKSLLA